MTKLFKLAKKLKTSLAEVKQERLDNLVNYLITYIDKELKLKNSRIYLHKVESKTNKDEESVNIELYFRPMEKSEKNSKDFKYIAGHVQELLNMYYGQVFLYFYTHVLIIPENIPNTAILQAYHHPTHTIYL